MATTRAKRKPADRADPPPRPDKELLLKLLEKMVLTRAVEDRMVSMYRSGDLLGSLYSGHWHEAISVGTAAALRPDDFLAPIHRDLGAHLWRGMDPAQVMASFMGKVTSPTRGRDGTLHYGRLDLNIYNLPSHIPDNYPVALGPAFAFRYRGQDGVSLAYCGDGSTSEGNFHETLNIAAVMKLPCIFVVENNQFAYSTPVRMQAAVTEFAVKAAGYGMPGVTVDGTDVLAVYDATAEAVRRARAGEGPSLVEAVTMRMHGHAEHDPADYVPREMLDEWQKRDPVQLYENFLLEHGVIDEDTAKQVRADARQQAIDARKKALGDPLPDASNVEEGVYAD
jgi:pyruvate dehydrogenase E1 component alpha subunit